MYRSHLLANRSCLRKQSPGRSEPSAGEGGECVSCQEVAKKRSRDLSMAFSLPRLPSSPQLTDGHRTPCVNLYLPFSLSSPHPILLSWDLSSFAKMHSSRVYRCVIDVGKGTDCNLLGQAEASGRSRRVLSPLLIPQGQKSHTSLLAQFTNF